MGPFVSSNNNLYMSQNWLKHKQPNDAKVVAKFLKKNIFTKFSTPRTLINDEGSHFCNKDFEYILVKYGLKHMIATAYNPQRSGQA